MGGAESERVVAVSCGKAWGLQGRGEEARVCGGIFGRGENMERRWDRERRAREAWSCEWRKGV